MFHISCFICLSLTGTHFHMNPALYYSIQCDFRFDVKAVFASLPLQWGLFNYNETFYFLC